MQYNPNTSNVDSTYIIDLPFNLSNNGRISIIPDYDHKAWRNKVVSLLSIGKDERIWYHFFGVYIEPLIFESGSEAAIKARAAIEEMFVKWAPELTLKDVAVSKNDISGEITLDIMYQLPNGELDSAKINTASLDPDGGIIEVQ